MAKSRWNRPLYILRLRSGGPVVRSESKQIRTFFKEDATMLESCVMVAVGKPLSGLIFVTNIMDLGMCNLWNDRVGSKFSDKWEYYAEKYGGPEGIGFIILIYMVNYYVCRKVEATKEEWEKIDFPSTCRKSS